MQPLRFHNEKHALNLGTPCFPPKAKPTNDTMKQKKTNIAVKRKLIMPFDFLKFKDSAVPYGSIDQIDSF